MNQNPKRIAIIIALLLLIITVYFFVAHQTRPNYDFGLIGNDGINLENEYELGIRLRLFSLSWRRMNPDEGIIDQDYIEDKLQELSDLYATGYDVILSMGIHDTPSWIHENYDNSYFVNQYGENYTSNTIDAGTANLVFNDELQQVVDRYVALIFSIFGDDFYAVRVGGGRYGELTYPPAEYNGRENNYWAFDDLALTQSPVPTWQPADDSPNNEASLFLNWYLEKLVEFQNWQIESVRQSFAGLIMVLYPSWGIRPTQIETAISTNLDGSSSAERNGEIQRGFDFARQISAIDDPNVIITTTWLDADMSQDNGDDMRYWSPVKYLNYLRTAHSLQLAMFGENTGGGTVNDMRVSIQQMINYDLLGILWFREDELGVNDYADWSDYQQFIQATNR